MNSSDEEDSAASDLSSDEELDVSGTNVVHSTQRRNSSEDSSSEEGKEDEVLSETTTRKRVYEWSDNRPATKRHHFVNTFSGLRVDFEESATHLDFFLYFISFEFVSAICTQINKYFTFLTEKMTTVPMRLIRWKPIEPPEFYCFLACSLLMPRSKKLAVNEYWSKDPLLQTPIFSDIMARDRYKVILRLLHFSDNSATSQDILVKIRMIVEHTKKKFREAVVPFENLVIDESLLLFKGRLRFKQYIPNKRSRFGIKIFVLCDVQTNYILDYIVYTGAATEIESGNADWGKSGDVVVSLLLPYLNKGHTIYLDNWYSSPTLFLWLHEKCTNATGTVRKNRKHLPPLPDKLKKGEIQFKSCGTLLALKWMDTKEVWMLSTIDGPEFVQTEKKDHKTGQNKVKPTCVVSYNKSMGAVDRTDMILSSVQCIRKTMKWYKKVFFHLTDLCVLNAKTIFEMHKKEKIPQAKFHLEIIRQLLEKFHSPTSKTQMPRTPTQDSPFRLQNKEGHYPGFLGATEKKEIPQRRCVVCAAHSQRKMTRIRCKKCEVALCMVPCFEKYHTLKKY